jgi:hypothetical protein
MSITVCLNDLDSRGLLDAERAAAYRASYDDLLGTYRKAMSAAAAAARASAETSAAIDADLALRKRQALLQVAAQKSILEKINAHMANGGKASDAAVALFDMSERAPGISNLDGRRRAILGEAHSHMTGILQTFSPDILGRVRDPALLANVRREAFGEATGDAAAAELVKGWRAGAERLRQRFNAAGGHIGKRADWGLPQIHNAEKVRQATYEEWRDEILPRLDLERMRDSETGQSLTGAKLETALRDAYMSIRSNGWDDRTPGGMGRPKLANTRADERFFVFKSADDWMAYQERFGADSPWDAMMGHLDMMSRDNAQMELLGPSPGVTVQWLSDLLEKDAQTSRASGELFSRVLDENRRAAGEIRGMFGIFNGEVNRPVSARMARGFATFRAVQTAAKLGGAALSAITDMAFQGVAARYNGLDYGKVLGNHIKLLNPANSEDRAFAISSGLIASEAAERMGALFRYSDDVNTPEVARRLASGVIRASGLSAWTQAGKWAFGMEFMHAMGRAAEMDWPGLPPKLRNAFERYGLTEADWATMRAAPRYEHKGASYLRPNEIDDARVRDLMLEMIGGETRFAVPEASLRARNAMTAGIRSGTISGELYRSVMQFKAFPVSILLTHGLRAVSQKTALGKAGYVANLAIMTTAFGGLAMQMKQVAAGKDARDMTEDKFWAAAFVQGGGAGLFGDFLYSDTNRFGGNIYGTLAGPGISTAVDAFDLTIGNLKQAAAGEKTNAGKEAVNFARANTPGSSLWYARLTLQRMFWDQLQQEVDPQARQAFRRTEQRTQREYDQKYWWAPGETMPERAPDLEAINGGSQ